MRKLLYTFLLLAYAAQRSPAPAQLSPNNLTHYSELDGTIIYDVMPDHQGNIWLPRTGWSNTTVMIFSDFTRIRTTARRSAAS